MTGWKRSAGWEVTENAAEMVFFTADLGQGPDHPFHPVCSHPDHGPDHHQRTGAPALAVPEAGALCGSFGSMDGDDAG